MLLLPRLAGRERTLRIRDSGHTGFPFRAALAVSGRILATAPTTSAHGSLAKLPLVSHGPILIEIRSPDGRERHQVLR